MRLGHPDSGRWLTLMMADSRDSDDLDTVTSGGGRSPSIIVPEKSSKVGFGQQHYLVLTRGGWGNPF